MSTKIEQDTRGIHEWEKWKRTSEPGDLSATLKSMEPIINEVPRANPRLNRSLLRSQARSRAIEAFETYDPEKGASLSTHVRNHLKPLTVRGYRQTRAVSRGRFIEETATAYKNEMREFEEKFGREPTAGEMSDRMKIGITRSRQLMDRAKFYEMPESQVESLQAVPGTEDTRVGRWAEYVYHDLPPRDQLIMDYRLGRNGKEKLGLTEIAKKMNMSTTAVHNVLTGISKRVVAGTEGEEEGLR